MIADTSAIVARGLGVRRGGRWLLRPADFGVAGGLIGLAGPPGAGKSALLATFATLRRPGAGALEILGNDIGKLRGRRRARARIGYLPDRLNWAESLTVGEFVGYAAYYKRVPVPVALAMAERLGLAEALPVELALLPPELRLRAGLAATCVPDPGLVLLDDPFAGLTDKEIAEAVPVLRSLAPTVLVTARETGLLGGVCDQVLTLARGRLTEQSARYRQVPAHRDLSCVGARVGAGG